MQLGTQRGLEWEEAHRRELDGKFDDDVSVAASRHGR